MGAGFLVVDLATNIARFGLSGQVAATAVLSGMGLLVLCAMVAWTLSRREIEEAARRVFGELATWDT